MQNVSLNHQRTIIIRTEDELLMCKDPFRIEKLQSILRERDVWNFRKWNDKQ